MNRIESILSRIFLVCLSLLLTFVLIEIGANYYLWNIASSNDFNYYASISQLKEQYGQNFLVDSSFPLYQPHHYLGYVTTYNYETSENRHNSLGFRGDEISIEKPEGIYRIVAIGASTTYGTSVDRPEDSYPARLEQYLQDNGYPNVEVINAGVGAYTSHETLMNLQFRVLELEPDLIILYQGSNDIHARLVWPPGDYRGDNSGFRTPLIQDTTLPYIWEYSTILRIIGIQLGWTTSQSGLEWSVFRYSSSSYYPDIERQMYGGIYPTGIFSEIPGDEMLQVNPPVNFERNLRSMIASANANDADMLLLSYVLFTKANWYKARSKPYVFGTNQHNEITQQVAEDMNAYFFDLVEVFPQKDKYFADGRHMTPEGNTERAKWVGKYIIESIFEVEN